MPSRCSFCSRLSDAASYVVAGPKGVSICDECASTAHTVAQEALRPHGTDRLVTGISRLMTNDPSWGSSFGIINNAAVAIRRGRVAWVGAEQQMPPQLAVLPRFDCGGRVAVPGFVDAFSQVTGTPGSPMTTEENSAEPTAEEAALEWAGRLLAGGATCMSVSVGTMGNLAEDKERVGLVNTLKQQLPMKVVASWSVSPQTGISPEDAEGRRYLREIAQYVSGLSIVVGDEGYSTGDARRITSTMGGLRKKARLHGAPGIPSDLVRSLRPLAVQDMTRLGELTLQALRHNGGVVVLLPMTSIRSRLPIRDLVDRGISVALGTGCLPGGRSVTSMPFLAWVASEAGEVPIETALWCATFGGARALGDKLRGWLGRGSAGDVAILEAGDFHELANHPDLPLVWELIREGDLTSARPADEPGI